MNRPAFGSLSVRLLATRVHPWFSVTLAYPRWPYSSFPLVESPSSQAENTLFASLNVFVHECRVYFGKCL